MKSAGVESTEQVFLPILFNLDIKNKYPTYLTSSDFNFRKVTTRASRDLINKHKKIKNKA
jgi:hypothetical protein